MKNKYYIAPGTAVDRFARVRIASLNYREGSDRNDDHGSLWIAPIVSANWNAPLGILAIYAETNGDPIFLGQIEDGEVAWGDTVTDGECEFLHRADWDHPSSGEGYSYTVMDALPAEREAVESQRPAGFYAGQITIAADFNAPMELRATEAGR